MANNEHVNNEDTNNEKTKQTNVKKSINSKIKIGDKEINRVMNASGCWAITEKQINEIANLSDNQTIITKTCTMKPNKVNPYPNYMRINESTFINCMGMPNMGYDYYKNLWYKYYVDYKTFIISMDASNWNDLKTMLHDYDEHIGLEKGFNISCELVELNVSCPNVGNVNSIRRLIAYDPKSLNELLEKLQELNLTYINFGIKLSPTPDVELVNEIAEVLNKYVDIVKYIVCSNSIPNCLILNNESGNAILSNKTGGVSGLPSKLLSISNVYQYSKILDSSITIIGCGGIETMEDIKDYFCAGAKCVQLGNIIYDKGCGVIEELQNELCDYYENF